MGNKITRGQFLSASIGGSILSSTKHEERAAGIQTVGYSDNDIQKILGGNAIRFTKAAFV
jgi:microsomal dipeptidase-like Zn-dependent dipeptidase